MKIKKEVKLGVFFIFTIALFVIGVLVFGKIRLSSGAYSFYIDFTHSGDLRENSKVRYRGAGIDIGFIEKMFINEYGDITVKVMMTDTSLQLPLDTVFSIQTVGMGIGEKYILADPPANPDPNIDFIREGDIIMGVTPMSIEATLGSLGDIGKDFDLSSITSILVDVQHTIALVNGILEDNEGLVHESISNVEGLSENLRRFSANIPRYERRIENILNNADASLASLKNITETIEKDKHRIPVIIRNFEAFSERLKSDPSALLFSKPQ